MKKIIGILSFFLVAGLILSLVFGFIGKIPDSVPAAATGKYKFLVGLGYFLRYIPSVITSGFIVSFCVHFGNNCEGSMSRFSSAMLERFKLMIIFAVSCSFILTLSLEVFYPLTVRGKKSIINRPKLINQYLKAGEQFFADGHYDRSYVYADAVLALDPNSRQAADLKDRSDVEINRENTSNIRFEIYRSSKENQEDTAKIHIDEKKISDAYRCYLKAKECFEKGEWINAHYYALEGRKLSTPKDPNVEELRNIATEAWNKITTEHDLAKNDDQKFFDAKFRGYLALVQNDDLTAYYIFRDLYLSSRDYSTDPDVLFYLDVAAKRIDERCFFDDEVFQLKSFENVNDICFSYTYNDGSKDIIYFRGMTSVKETGRTVQYLRNLTIQTLNESGSLFRTMTVPYAKVLPVSIKSINDKTKELLGIDKEVTIIPYIMLNSVGRDSPDVRIEPLYVYESGEIAHVPEYILLPMNYSDFTMLETQTNEPERIPFGNLFKLIKKASQFGYSSEVYCEALLNRIFYPFWIVILLIGYASVAWNYRIGYNKYFKMTWVFSFPFIIFLTHIMNKWLLYIFKLFNYVIVGLVPSALAIIAGFIFYSIILVSMSIYFLARHTSK